MPVMLSNDDESPWLSPAVLDAPEATAIVLPAQHGLMEEHAVDQRVNRSTYDSQDWLNEPECFGCGLNCTSCAGRKQSSK